MLIHLWRWLFLLASLLTCVAVGHAQEVIPDFYRDPGKYPNRSYVNQGFNEFIDPFTGSLQHHYVDLRLPVSGGLDLKVVRSYNTASIAENNPVARQSLAGIGWTVHFGRVLKARTSNPCLNQNALSVADNAVLELPDGSRDILAFTGSFSPLMLTVRRWRADCISGGTGLAVYSPDGTRYDMTQLVNVGTATSPLYAWYTTRITDRNGNYAAIHYAQPASPEISTIVDDDERVLSSFYYFEGGTENRRISRILGPEGQAFEYSYQPGDVGGKFFLAAVKRPDGTSWNYSYFGNLGLSPGSYLMSQAVHPQGGIIRYTYGYVTFDVQQGRTTVLTSKSLDTGGTWRFSYVPGAPNTPDTTTIESPAGMTTYRHAGANYSLGNGSVWMIGLLLSKAIGGLQSESYTWDKQKISSESNVRPGAFVTKVDEGAMNAALLVQKRVVRDGATYLTSYGNFDGYGNPRTVSESGPNGGTRSTTLSYHTDWPRWIVNLLKNECVGGSSLVREFDVNGNLLEITLDGVTTHYTYDRQGNMASALFPRGLLHSYGNYKRGIPQSETQPEGVSYTRTVSDAGNVVSETNGEGRTTHYRYDGLNRIVAIGHPVGNGVSVFHSMNSRIASRGGLTEVTAYDGFGNPASISLGGISKTFTYDALGRKTFESDPGRSTGDRYQYDILNRPTRTTHADGSFLTYSYGPGTVTIVDERGMRTVRAYRAYGDPGKLFLMSVTTPEAGANVTLARNARDLVTSVTQGGLTRTYSFDASYRLVAEYNPETGQTVYGRDAAGNMISRSVGASGVTSFSYDGQNRLVSASYPGTTPAGSYSYSRTGKLRRVASSVAVRTYDYDGNDNLVTETLALDGLSVSAKYAYNANDQLSAVTYPVSGRTVSYYPDVLGRPSLVSGYVNSLSYWPSGQVRQIAYANGVVSVYDQNLRLWPASFATLKGSTAYLSNVYGYDGAGNLASITDGVDKSYSRVMGYDALGRLTSVSGPWGGGVISYSGSGNILSQSLGSYGNLSYSYDGQNRLAGVSGSRNTSFGYDAYGDVTYGWGNSYGYDGVPNLVQVNCANANYCIQYAYDGANKRVSVTRAGMKTYEFFGMGGNLLAEYTPAQRNRLVEYIYLGSKRVAQRVSTR